MTVIPNRITHEPDPFRALELDAHLVMLEQDRDRLLQLLIGARRQLQRALDGGTDAEVTQHARDAAGLAWAHARTTRRIRAAETERALLRGEPIRATRRIRRRVDRTTRTPPPGVVDEGGPESRARREP